MALTCIRGTGERSDSPRLHDGNAVQAVARAPEGCSPTAPPACLLAAHPTEVERIPAEVLRKAWRAVGAVPRELRGSAPRRLAALCWEARRP